MAQQIAHGIEATNLADILERVLDKGIVIAGDIQIKLADVELLTIKIRLLIASVDKAKEMGINWWETDSYLSTRAAAKGEEEGLPSSPSRAREIEAEKEKIELEKKVQKLEAKSASKSRAK